MASEKFLNDFHLANGGEDDEEWPLNTEELSAFPIYDEVTWEVIIGWEVDAI